jgi:hypothetical protein
VLPVHPQLIHSAQLVQLVPLHITLVPLAIVHTIPCVLFVRVVLRVMALQCVLPASPVLLYSTVYVLSTVQRTRSKIAIIFAFRAMPLVLIVLVPLPLIVPLALEPRLY